MISEYMLHSLIAPPIPGPVQPVFIPLTGICRIRLHIC